ncbi:MAG: NUDIX hydrolase [Chloroflexi bacterium]|nr:MAG: NUDIX hydrolase [Chloroflexota bacterium]
MTALTATNSAGFRSPAGLTAVPVVLAPLTGRLHVLLVQRGETSSTSWQLPGGFMSASERPEETAQRKLTEKTGVGAVYLEQLQTYAEPEHDPRGWIPTIAYLALIDAAVLRDESGARWVPVDDLPPLDFDHARIVRDGVERLRGKLWWSNIAVGLLPEQASCAPPACWPATALDDRLRCTSSSSGGRPGACAARARRRPFGPADESAARADLRVVRPLL